MIRPSSSSGARVLILSLTAQIATMMPVFLLGSLFPLIRLDLGLGAGALGTVVASFFGFSAMGSAGLAGYSDRYGPWIVARIALGATACLCAALPLAGGMVSLMVLMAAAGLANGCVQPATNVAVSTAVAPHRQGFAFGLKQASIPLAALFAGLAVPLVALPAGWQAAFWIAAFLPLCLVLLLPSRKASASARPAVRDAGPGWSRATLVKVGIISGLGAGSANAMAAFFVTSASAQGISVALAGGLMAVGGAVSIAMRIILGLLADRVNLPLMAVTALLLAGGVYAYALLALGGGLTGLVLATLLAFGMGWGWAGLMLLAIVRGNRAAPGRATGVVQTGLFLGAVAGPLGFGWIAAHVGLSAAWWTLAAAGTAATILALRVAPIVRLSPEPATTPG